MRRLLLALILASLAAPAAAEDYPLTAAHWDLALVAQFVERDGRPAVRLGNPPGQPLRTGVAGLRGVSFTTGTIEYDVLVEGNRDFVGFSFRDRADGNGELFYIRPLQNGNPDATQYTPVVNGSPAWQIFSGDGFTSAVRFTPGRWMRVRADVHPTSMTISIDGAPALRVPYLQMTPHAGAINLNAVGGAYFSNVRITPIADYPDPNPPPPEPPLRAGTVATWQVSPAMPEAEAMTRAAARNWAGVDWQVVPTENHGVANLSLAGADAEGRNTYIARFSARSRAAQDALLEFGFSNSVRVFLNGRPLYAGADLQGSRDYRFLGIVGFWDSLFLPLQAGANEIVFVVSDATNGGTAAAARFAPELGLTLE